MTVNFTLDPASDNYCVIGNPVAHSKSPLIHQAFARQTGEHINYQAILIEIDGLQRFLDRFQNQGGKGLNVTLPFKQDAWQAMAVNTIRADRAGSVNTIWFNTDGTRHGDTTDGRGLLRDLSNSHIDPRNKQVLILGAGGAVRGILQDLFESGPADVTIVNRTHARATALARQFTDFENLHVLPVEQLGSVQFDIIINGTSASLQGEMPALPPQILADAACCYDMVYGDTDTVFVRWARQNGAAVAMDGLGMLVEQAAESFYIWRGVRPETKPVIDMLRKK